MAAIRVTTNDPAVARSETGSVHVQLTDDVYAVFRTEEHYNAWREQLDREQVGHDQEAYWTRMQSLRAELQELRS